MRFQDLPAIGRTLQQGTFQGIISRPRFNRHDAVVLLSGRLSACTWQQANELAKASNAFLPDMQTMELLRDDARLVVPCGYHWTSNRDGAYASACLLAEVNSRIVTHISTSCYPLLVRYYAIQP